MYKPLGAINMITAVNIETNLWNRIISLLKEEGWIETHRYKNFDAGIDSDFIILEKEENEILFGWDNWLEGEIQSTESLIEEIESKVGITLEKGEPVSLKQEVVKLCRLTTKL